MRSADAAKRRSNRSSGGAGGAGARSARRAATPTEARARATRKSASCPVRRSSRPSRTAKTRELAAELETEPEDHGCVLHERVDLPAATELFLFQLREHLVVIDSLNHDTDGFRHALVS